MSYTPLVDTIFSGDARAITPAANDNDTSIATTAFVQSELGDYLSLSGGTMTGDITLGSGIDINFNDTSSGLQWSDVRLDRSAANIISLGSGDKIQQNAAPTAGDDLVNKTYADSLASGLDLKDSVRVATAAALPAYTRTASVITADANGALAAVDGVTLVANDRLLLKDGAAGADNGIYEVTTVGDGSNPFVLTRVADADSNAEVTAGMFTFVEEGTAHADQGWVLTTNDPITLNTTALAFSQFSSASVVSNLNDLTDVNTSGVADGSLLRYEATGTVWEDTSALLFNDAGQLQVTTTGASAGILLGGDANLYRSAADVLKTDDDLHVGSSIQMDASAGLISSLIDGSAGGIVLGAGSDVNLYRSAADVLKTDDDMHVGSSIQMDASAGLIKTLIDGSAGGLTFGSTSDVNLYRSAANTLKTDDNLHVALALTVDGNINLTDGDGLAWSDVSFYRDSANHIKLSGELRVDDKLTVGGGLSLKYGGVKTAAYTAALATDYIIPVDTATTGAFSVALPSGHTAGDMFIIKDVVGNCGTANCTIDPNASETIDGSTTFVMTVNFQSVTVVSDGTNWFVV